MNPERPRSRGARTGLLYRVAGPVRHEAKPSVPMRWRSPHEPAPESRFSGIPRTMRPYRIDVVKPCSQFARSRGRLNVLDAGRKHSLATLDAYAGHAASSRPFAFRMGRNASAAYPARLDSARPREGRQGWSPRRANAQRLPSQTLAIDRFLACLYGRSRRTSVAVVGRDKPSKLSVRSAADRPRNVPRLRVRCARIGIPLPCAQAGAEGGAGIGIRTLGRQGIADRNGQPSLYASSYARPKRCR